MTSDLDIVIKIIRSNKKGIMVSMKLHEKLQNSLKTAMKARDEDTKRTLRLVLSAIKLAEIEEGKEIEELRILSILQKEVKTREDLIEEAKTIEREDLIETAKKEIQILTRFLPQQMNEADLEKLAVEIIEETGAESIKDMGLIMKNLMPKLQGRASGQDASRIVRELLHNNS
jgi:hypothetical protein